MFPKQEYIDALTDAINALINEGDDSNAAKVLDEIREELIKAQENLLKPDQINEPTPSEDIPNLHLR